MSSKRRLLYSRLLTFLVISQIFFSLYFLVAYLVPVAKLPQVKYFLTWLSPFIGLACLYIISQLKLAGHQQQLEYLNSQHHDFINHLQTIIGFIELQKPPVAEAYAREVVRGLTKGELKGQTSNESLHALLIGITEYAEHRGVPVTFSMCPQVLEGIPLPASSLSRLVGNLLHNAVDAVEGMNTARSKVHFSVDFRDDQWFLEVSNPGPAIPAATFDKIFDPGFSTKAKSGRGLGLSIVKSITQQYGGQILVESNDKAGTKFTIVIPNDVNSNLD